MAEEMVFAKGVSIRQAGKDEYWLQDQIFDNPSCLGLGDLESLDKERRQLSGGRLDILLKNPEDDSMYEVEVMLGETNEAHIIRTIEYWDNEKRRWPQRQHFAVLIAEHINRRFFNVIHLLSNAIPIIAIQVSLLESHGKQSLYFSKILDTFEEIDDGTTIENIKYTREDWIKKAKWTVETADVLAEITLSIFPEQTLNYVKHYVAITVNGYNYLWLHKRSLNKSLLGFRLSQTMQDEVCLLFDQKNISYTKKQKEVILTVDKKIIELNKELFTDVAKIIKKFWEK